ncbi:MAG: hypothetical protein GYA33_09995, partial [Thermogutta sp.]|nr:hypothetical protein [Thermogutta sp.]
ASDVSAAKQRLIEAVDRLQARLDRDKGQGDNWRKYLRLDELAAELKKPAGPSLETLGAVYAKFAAGHEGLKLACFVEVRRALRQFIVRSRAVDDASLPEKLGQALDELPPLIQAYRESHDPAVAGRIQAVLEWLDLMDRGRQVVATVEREFGQSNLFVEVSADLLAKGFTKPVDTTEPVREIILGTDVRGTGHIVGRRTLRLLPASDRAELAIEVTGSIAADTVGYNGPARIYSQGDTPFTARKVVRISAAGVEILPADADARTRTKIQDVDVTCRGNCVEKIAWKRTFKQKPAAEWEASRRAEFRLNRRIDREADERLNELRTAFEERFRRPLLDRDLFPEVLDFRTDEQALRVEARRGGPFALAAAGEPPAPPAGDLTVRLHQTFFNNMAEGALAGMFLREERFREIVTDLLGRLPPELESEDSEPWAVQFPPARPITVRFDDGRAVVQFRGEAYEKGDRRYAAMDVTAAYRLERRDAGFVLLREAEPTAFPPDFDPQKDHLSVSQQTLRRLLERRFGKIFRPEIALEPVELEGDWAAAGPLTVASIQMDDGWLAIGLRAAPSDAVAMP